MEDKYFLNINPADFFALKKILKKTKVTVKIIEKKGIAFWLKKQAKRKIFMITPFICLFLLWLASQFLWSVKINGNLSITDDLVESFLKESGVYYGIPLSKIPIYDLKTNLRNQFSEITWVSMKLNGTCLEISLKENTDSFLPEIKSEERMDLVAQADGVIDSILVREGTVLKTEGDEVKKGEVLIEGKVDIPAEDGSIKETVYCKADGDVWLEYDYPVYEQQSLEYNTKNYTGKKMTKLLFYCGNKKWGVDLRKIPYVKYDYLEEIIENPILKVLSIPVDIQKITYRDYVIQREKYTLEEANKILSEKLDKIIVSLEEKGVQIIEKNVKIKNNSVCSSLYGTLKIREQCNELKNPEEFQ